MLVLNDTVRRTYNIPGEEVPPYAPVQQRTQQRKASKVEALGVTWLMIALLITALIALICTGAIRLDDYLSEATSITGQPLTTPEPIEKIASFGRWFAANWENVLAAVVAIPFLRFIVKLGSR